MEKITSFTINHILLQPGVYVSRKDLAGETTVTTFDIRMTSPNEEPVMNTAEVHTIEHLGATFLRNHETWKSSVLYFGPMGCRTGFYLLLTGDHSSEEILPLMIEMFEFIRDYKGEVPGASPLPHYPGPSGLSGIKTIPGSVRAAFDLPLPEPGYFYACFLLFFGSSFRKSR